MGRKNIILWVLLSFFNGSCTERKFNTKLWLEQDDLHSYPNRKYIVDDLLNKHPLKGLSFDSLTKLIGAPDDKIIYTESSEIYYPIETKYEFLGVDPVYEKILAIKLSQDSSVESFRILEPKEN